MARCHITFRNPTQAHTCDNLLELPNYWESLLQTRGVKGGPAAVARGAAALTPEQLTELRDETRRILGERLEIAVLNFQVGQRVVCVRGGVGGGARVVAKLVAGMESFNNLRSSAASSWHGA